MLKGRYYVFDSTLPNGGTGKLWVDGGFQSLRRVDPATFARLRAIWKSRSALFLVVLLPAGALLLLLLAAGGIATATALYILFAALLIDLAARAGLAWHERRAIGALTPHPIPPEQAEAMRAAAKAGDVEALRAAASAAAAALLGSDR